jgi:hypothetical protein
MKTLFLLGAMLVILDAAIVLCRHKPRVRRLRQQFRLAPRRAEHRRIPARLLQPVRSRRGLQLRLVQGH